MSGIIVNPHVRAAVSFKVNFQFHYMTALEIMSASLSSSKKPVFNNLFMPAIHY